MTALSELRNKLNALMDYRLSLDPKHQTTETAATDAKIRAVQNQIDSVKDAAKRIKGNECSSN